MKTAAPRPFHELPRPVRVASDSNYAALYRLLAPHLPPDAASMTSMDVFRDWLMLPGEMGLIMRKLLAHEQGAHGGLYLTLETICHGKCAVFEIDPTLVELLLATDMSTTHPVPASFVRLPLDTPIFIHLPKPPPELAVVAGEDSLPLSGYYLRQVATEYGRVLEVVAASIPPPGNKSIDDDNFLYADLPIPSELEDQDLLNLFDAADRNSRELQGEQDRPDLRGQMAGHLNFIVKLLVYLSMPQVRRDVHAERTDAITAIAGLGERKRAQAMQRISKIYDFIKIGAPFTSEASDGSGTHASPSVHMRRGHFRMARVGQGRVEQRLTWVRPTIVAGALAPARAYRVN